MGGQSSDVRYIKKLGPGDLLMDLTLLEWIGASSLTVKVLDSKLNGE